MTEERLKAYRALKQEQEQLERLIEEEGGELRKLYRDKREEVIAEQKEVEKALALLMPHERELMRAYYIDGLRWCDVAKVCHYSEAQTYRLRDWCLKKLERA